jgi:hypothetical protein
LIQPFAPLPVRRRRKRWRALAEIRRLDAAMLGAVRTDATFEIWFERHLA